MIVVSDTSPLNYLIQIGSIDILPVLFGSVLIPPAVLNELRHAQAPPMVQAWAASPPVWLDIKAPAQIDTTLNLDLGETETISLAVELTADQLLADDAQARSAAMARGIPVTGTLGVFITAAQFGLVKLSQVAALVQQTNFRASAAVWQAFINAVPGPTP